MSTTTGAYRAAALTGLRRVEEEWAMGNRGSAANIAYLTDQAAKSCRLSALPTCSADMDDVYVAEYAARRADSILKGARMSDARRTSSGADVAEARRLADGFANRLRKLGVRR